MYSSAGHGINISGYALNLSITLRMLTTVSNLWKPRVMEITKKQTNKILTQYSCLGLLMSVCFLAGGSGLFGKLLIISVLSFFKILSSFQRKSRGFWLDCTFLNVRFKMATLLHSELQRGVSALSDSHCFLPLPEVKYVSCLLLNDKLSVIFLQIHKTD